MQTEERTKQVIDLSIERPLSLNEARKILPGNPSHPTVYRYATTGMRGAVLETIKLGRARFTSVSAIQRFIDQLVAEEA
jgi:hypothetical protein